MLFLNADRSFLVLAEEEFTGLPNDVSFRKQCYQTALEHPTEVNRVGEFWKVCYVR